MPRSPIAQYWEVPVNLLNFACQELTNPQEIVAASRTNTGPSQCYFCRGMTTHSHFPYFPQILPQPEDIQTSRAHLSLSPLLNKQTPHSLLEEDGAPHALKLVKLLSCLHSKQFFLIGHNIVD